MKTGLLILLASALCAASVWMQFYAPQSDHQRLNRLEEFQASQIVTCTTDTDCETKNPGRE